MYVIVRGIKEGNSYKLRNCKLLGILRTYPQRGSFDIRSAEERVRAFMHPSGDYNKNAGEDGTQRGGCQIRTTCIRARYLFHPTHECPWGVIIALLNSKKYFFSNNMYIHAQRGILK